MSGAAPREARVVRKAVAYVVRRGRLLVFTHDDVPIEVTGVQVPSGTVEAGESPAETAVREVFEETGLRARVVRELGTGFYDVRPAKGEVHERHFFQLAPVESSVPERWQAGEEHPSEGQAQRWTCSWAPLEHGHVLCAGFGALLGRVVAEAETAADPKGLASDAPVPGESSVAGTEAFLRPLAVGDAPEVLEAFRSNPDMDRQGRVTTLEEARRYVENLVTGDSPHDPWAIVDGGRLVGLVCVSVDEDNRSGWFWYWMNAAARGRGLMSRAAATIADRALLLSGLERLELGHRVNNPASGAVAQAAGFVREGTERGKFLIEGQRIDVATYGRLRSDPRPSCDPLDVRLAKGPQP